MRAAVGRARTVEVIRAGENLEARLVLDDELLQELAIEPVQVVDRVEHAVARPDAEKQRDLAEARLQVDDHRSAACSGARARRRSSPPPSSCRRRPWRRRTRASCAAGRAPCVVSRRAAVRRMAPWNVSSAGGQMKNSFAPARIDWRIRSGSAASATAKIAGAGRRRAQPLDAGHRRRRVAADVDDDEVGRQCRRGRTVVDDADRDGARAQQPPDLLLERVVRRDDETDELRHESLPFTIESPRTGRDAQILSDSVAERQPARAPGMRG